jgi:type III pantothenate kinase
MFIHLLSANLLIDVGNTSIHTAYIDKKIIHEFRVPTKNKKDLYFEYLKDFCLEHQLTDFTHVAVSSVVPELNDEIRLSCDALLGLTPIFLTGYTTHRLLLQNKDKIGADLVCAAEGALSLFPNKNICIVDLGTATTLTALDKNGALKTVLILPGLNTQLSSLHQTCSKLPLCSFLDTHEPTNSTERAMKTGVYYGHLGGIERCIDFIKDSEFKNEQLHIVTTGGFGKIYASDPLFKEHQEHLIFDGMLSILDYIKSTKKD